MRIHEVKKISLVLFTLGFLIGIVYVNLFARTYITSMGIFSQYFLEEYRSIEINIQEYIIYILKIRILPLLLLVILGSTMYRKIAASIYILWTGFSIGLILTTAILKLNMKGIVLCIVGIMPHFICYGAAYIMMLIYIFTYPEIRWNGTKTISMVTFMLLGIISECYVNPVLIDMFISVL